MCMKCFDVLFAYLKRGEWNTGTDIRYLQKNKEYIIFGMGK